MLQNLLFRDMMPLLAVNVTGVTALTEPSQTALAAAAARAAHLIVDAPPFIFTDSLAAALLGDRAEELIGYHRDHASHPVLAAARAQVTCRSRYTEDNLARAAAGGVRQYLILGAGLDSFGYRPGLASQVRVFEVDHPATQEWKRQALAAAQIPVPRTVTFVPADLATTSLADVLPGSGFDPAQPALVSWLGVTVYLTRDATSRVLAAIGALAPGTELIADYMLPASMRDAAGNSYVEQVSPFAAEGGEPWLTFLSPGEAAALLAGHGIEPVEHVRQRDAVGTALWQRADSLRPTELSVLTRARVSTSRGDDPP
jgi:methyltransferase (TIGR00027 family)